MPKVYTSDMIYTLVFQYFKICSHWTKFHEKRNYLKLVSLKNGFPLSFIDKYFQMVINKLVM